METLKACLPNTPREPFRAVPARTTMPGIENNLFQTAIMILCGEIAAKAMKLKVLLLLLFQTLGAKGGFLPSIPFCGSNVGFERTHARTHAGVARPVAPGSSDGFPDVTAFSKTCRPILWRMNAKACMQVASCTVVHSFSCGGVGRLLMSLSLTVMNKGAKGIAIEHELELFLQVFIHPEHAALESRSLQRLARASPALEIATQHPGLEEARRRSANAPARQPRLQGWFVESSSPSLTTPHGNTSH